MMKKIFLLNCLFFLFVLQGCARLSDESYEDYKILEGMILNESSKLPLVSIEVSLYKLNKPLFSMRGWEKLETVKTDNSGKFVFKITKPGPYEVRWNPELDVVSHEYPVDNFEEKK